MKKSFLFCLLFLAVFLAGFAGSAYAQLPKYLYGIISFYSDDYEGKTTAGGDKYDPDQLTAAHQTLPFGSEVEVENLENGKKVKVRINDRGPFTESRILDVSRRTADLLGFSKKGTVYAKITLVKIGDNKVRKQSTATNASYSSAESSSAETGIVPAGSSAPSVSYSSSGSAVSVQTKVNVINRTNTAVLYQTNMVEMTNYNEMTKTNIVEIPPYEEKFVENEVIDRKTPDGTVLKDDFILDEPLENTVTDGGQEKAVVRNQAPEPELPLPEEIRPIATNETAETIVPQTLLPNEEAISVEKTESQGEALKEGGGKSGRYVVQAGAFSRETYALRLYDRLKDKGFDVFTAEARVHGKKWYRVRIGYFNDSGSAKSVMDRLKSYKIKSTLVKIK